MISLKILKYAPKETTVSISGNDASNRPVPHGAFSKIWVYTNCRNYLGSPLSHILEFGLIKQFNPPYTKGQNVK